MQHPSDLKWMRRALTLAKKAWGKTSPNPMVGAVVVRDGECVGEGYHHAAGTPHAEVHALAAAGELACGATLYVTLEPCSTYGRTPPCTDAIIRAGIRRVFFAVKDPNPAHAGHAIPILESAGIQCHVGLCESACRELNERFFHWIQFKKPFVLLKMGMTLDGKIATANGNSQWITSPISRQRVQYLRRGADAILVGGETVRHDHPSLSVRIPKNWKRQPLRYVASRTLSAEDVQSLMPGAPTPDVVHFDSPEVARSWLNALGQKEVMSLLIEGGGELAAQWVQWGLVDKIEFHMAPKLLTGNDARSVLGGLAPLNVNDAIPLYRMSIQKQGNDWRVVAYLKEM